MCRNLFAVFPCDVFDTQYVSRNNMSRAMSRSSRPPLAGGSVVTDGKQYSKLSRHGLAARRAADRAKLLANLAGDRAGGPATRSAGAPSTPSTPTSPQTRSERYALRSAEKSISKTLGESSSPDGSERYPSGAPAKLVDGDDDDDDDDEDDDDDDEDVDDCSSGGDQRMEFQRRQRDAASSAMAQLKPPPLEIVFQPPTNDPGENNGVVADEPSPADSVMDDMFNAWRCGSCTYQNLGRAKGACNMCNDPHPLREGLSLDPWEISELEARSLRQVTASPPPPTTRRPATNVMRVSFVCQSRMIQITSPFASTAMVRSTWSAPIYYSSRSQVRTVSSPRRICRNTQRCDCVRCHWPRGSLCMSVYSAKTELFDRGYR